MKDCAGVYCQLNIKKEAQSSNRDQKNKCKGMQIANRLLAVRTESKTASGMKHLFVPSWKSTMSYQPAGGGLQRSVVTLSLAHITGEVVVHILSNTNRSSI